MATLAFVDVYSWLNYPGLELWKFANLAIFLAVAIFVLRRPLGEALLSRRESIKQEIVKAQLARDEALSRVADAEAQLAKLEADISLLKQRSRVEADSERQRMALATEREIEKMRAQALRQAENASKVAKQELREFLAKRSVELARESLVKQIGGKEDSQLISEGIGELRRNRI